jgi:hypothetical protein
MCKLCGGVEDILPTPNRVIDAPFDCMLVAYKDSNPRIRIAVHRLHLKRGIDARWMRGPLTSALLWSGNG